ncbi:MAG: hypothetical protein ACOVQE_03625 [Chitinophagaceae bacterium]
MNSGDKHIKLEDLAKNMQNMSAYYHMPENYFQELPALLADKINIDALNNGQEKIPYQIPIGYFENLESIIFNKLNIGNTEVNDKLPESLNELTAIAPTLAKKKIGLPYQVEENFFQQLVAVNVPSPKQAKLVSLASNMHYKKLFAAASVIIIVFTTALVWQNKSVNAIANTTINLEDSLSKIPDAALQEYVQNHVITDTEFSNDMAETLLNTNVEEHLQEYSDEELTTFLKENEQLNSFKKRI